jgi:serine/threonine-protein kinase RsbW/stage II sporulation protein AB (anti-sigma F factor)
MRTVVSHHVKWTVPARPDQAGPLRRMVTSYACERGMPEARLSELALAVGEAIANAVVHAYHDRPAGTVDVTAGCDNGELLVAVADRGGGLVPRTDSPGLGLGLSMISQIVDGLSIGDREGGGTEVRMSFVMAPPAA